MDIVEFFELSSGKWLSQRSSHHFDSQQSEASKSDLVIELLDKAAPEVVKVCEQYCIDPAIALCGAKVSWSSTADLDAKKTTGSTVLVPVASPETNNEGQLLRDVGSPSKPPVPGRYVLGSDEALTLITEDETIHVEERLWFASPNLRLRTSMLKRAGGSSTASFFSEIRMGGAK
jgi:hypothetical protein